MPKKKFLSRLKYPKFIFLFLTFIAGYVVSYGETYGPLREFILSIGYFGSFLAGILYTYGFTAGIGTSVFLILSRIQDIFLAGLIGGLGSLFADMIIFEFIRHSFADEVKKLSKERIIQHIDNFIPEIFKKHFLVFMALFIIASPLPDEIGVMILATATRLHTKTFAILSFILNTMGIMLILKIGSAVPFY